MHINLHCSTYLFCEVTSVLEGEAFLQISLEFLTEIVIFGLTHFDAIGYIQYRNYVILIDLLVNQRVSYIHFK